MSAKPRLIFQAPDLGYDASLTPEVFRSLSLGSGALESLIAAMAPYGGTPQGIKMDAPAEEVWRSYISVSILGGFGLAWIGATALGLQLTRFPVRPEPRVLSEIVTRLLAVVQESSNDTRIAAHNFTFTLHGRLEGLSPDELLGRYVNPPPEILGPVAASSGGYTLGEDKIRQSLSLRFEPSLSIQPGLFVTAQLTFKAEEVSASEAPQAALDIVAGILNDESFPLEVEWNEQS